MFARGSYGDADHRGTDLEADIFSNATSNFRSDEAAGSRANVSAKPVSYNTTYRATVISTYRPAVRGAVASTFSGADIVTDCPADRGADESTFSATDCVADYPANGLADEGAHGGASISADTSTDCGAGLP